MCSYYDIAELGTYEPIWQKLALYYNTRWRLSSKLKQPSILYIMGGFNYLDGNNLYIVISRMLMLQYPCLSHSCERDIWPFPYN